jgi:uncharacterized protein
VPLVHPSSYQPPWFLRNGHLQTISASLFRRVPGITYQRRRIETPDGDFLDLDYSVIGAQRVGLISHGLEGDSRRAYVLGMVRALNRRGWDAVAWNFRGCSGEANRRLRLYHSGATDDLATVLAAVLGWSPYRRVALIGFSIGGNITLKYLGERGHQTPSAVCAAVAFSVPCDLASGAIKMARPGNALYMHRFLGMLHAKVRRKTLQFPGQIDDRDFQRMRTFKDFDERYTAPLHGFADAEDYWEKASSKPVLGAITVPTLLVNALDDPFLAPPCYPYQEALSNPRLTLETPATGGHVGFITVDGDGSTWSEVRAMEFLGAQCL